MNNIDVIEKTQRSLKSNGINSFYYKNISDLFQKLKEFILDDTTVGIADSKTLEELGVYDYLRLQKINFLDKYINGITKEEKSAIYTKNFSADVFISGANAITYDGKIYNLDGNGSRVAPMQYGPKKVLLLCGTNKIVPTELDAIQRIKSIAAPLDAKSLGKNTPCAKTGYCVDCKSIDRICNYWSIIQGQFDRNRINVLFIEGNYGF